nr:MAG TPA: hypothetical protein [Caudoviricetes sp.]
MEITDNCPEQDRHPTTNFLQDKRSPPVQSPDIELLMNLSTRIQ